MYEPIRIRDPNKCGVNLEKKKGVVRGAHNSLLKIHKK
jgi:hypothetical protein